MDTASVHVCAAMLNYMRYDVGNMGNHDVETGHAVYDRWVGQCDFPILGANIVDVKTGKPYLKPYEVLERNGVKVVVLGMITPAVPSGCLSSYGPDFVLRTWKHVRRNG